MLFFTHKYIVKKRTFIKNISNTHTYSMCVKFNYLSQYFFFFRFLLCGSNDCQAYIWKTDSPNTQPWVLKGHLGEVTSVTWSPNNGDKVIKIVHIKMNLIVLEEFVKVLN